MSRSSRTRPVRALLLAGGLGGALLLAACSSSSGGSTGGAQPSPAGAGSSTSPAAAGGPAARGPAASGKIAAITGTTMQVQNQQTGQVAVRWTGKTAFTAEVSATASAIKVGSCVTVAGGSGTSTSATSFTAATVRLEPTCTTGRPGGTRPSGAPSGFPGRSRPSGFPSGARPSGGFPRAGTARAFANGKVTAVSGSKLTVSGRGFGSSGTTTRTVTIAASTRITTTAAATAKSLAVGKCVTAQGDADTSGTVTATRVAISNPSNGTCSVGFGRVGSGG